MDTPIGHILRTSRVRTWCAVVVALATIGANFCFLLYFTTDAPIGVVVCVAILLLALLARGDRASLGIVIRLRPSYRYWIKVTLGIGVAIGAVCVVAGVILWAFDVYIPILALPPRSIISTLVFLCVFAPIFEEALYRLVLCAPLAVLVGPWWAIFLSGSIFAGLHFVGGNLGPDNFIAGYFFAWVYLKSGSIVTPVVLHSLGNACVVAVWVANWYRM